jgi:hypothetical protein
MSAAELHVHLDELRAERALAAIEGLTGNPAYMADLCEEIAATREAYVRAAVTEIAIFRSQLSTP